MSKVANDIVLQLIADIETGRSPSGALLEALHFLWFNSCPEEQGKLEAILKSLNDRGIRSHLSEIKAFPFPSDSARKVVLETVSAIESEAVSSPSDAIAEAADAGKKFGLDPKAFMRPVMHWLDDEIRKVLPKLKEHPFVDPYGSA